MFEEGSQWIVLARTLGSLALVLALIFALSWVSKKFIKPEKWAKHFAGLRIVHSLPIGSKKKLMIVEVEGKRLLIGVGGESISALCEIDGVKEENIDQSELEIKRVEKA